MKILFSSKIIAKSNGTSLEQHIDDCKKIMDVFLESKEKLLKNKLKSLDKEYDLFIKNIYKSVIFHDFGKATNQWQEKCKQEDNLPIHALFSGYFLSIIKKNSNLIPLLVVISHHSILSENSFSCNLNNELNFNEDVIAYITGLAKKYGFNINKYDNLNNYINKLNKFKERSQHPKHRSLENKESIINIFFKAEYCLMLTYLTKIDGLASCYEDKNKKINLNEIKNRFLSSESICSIIKDTSKNKTLTEIQYGVLNEPCRQLILEAPCGEGKTLAALLFSQFFFEKNLIDKIIFVLPTQVTSNNMYNEFKEEYHIPKEFVGIYHSEIMSLLLDEDDMDSNLNFVKYDNLIYAKQFNISTIDHLLLTLINGYKHAPRAFGNLITSTIVIDELHYYDQYTLSLIEKLCEILDILNVPHIIMSATMPTFIKNRFSDEKYKKISSSGYDKNSISKNPYNIQYHEEELLFSKKNNITQEFKEILDENINKNIGIIVNTVKRAREIYDTIKKLYPQKQILLYHSQFMKKDRPIKEALLKSFHAYNHNKKFKKEELLRLKKYNINPDDNLIFIGTQVAEISLNISFDILISELAPLDALIQRGGRLHRSQTYNNSSQCSCIQCQKLKDHNYIFHIFSTGNLCYPYYTDKEDLVNKKIINNTKYILKNNNNYTFENSKKWINYVYPMEFINEKKYNADKKKYEDAIKEDLIFGKKPVISKDGNTHMRFETRQINSSKRLVLPEIIIENGKEQTYNELIKTIIDDENYKFKLLNHMIYITNMDNNEIETINIHNMTINLIKTKYSFEKGLF